MGETPTLLGSSDVFKSLKGQDGGADLAGLAVPDQLDLALVLEEEEAVLLRQRLPGLEERDQVALLGVGEIVGRAFGHGVRP